VQATCQQFVRTDKSVHLEWRARTAFLRQNLRGQRSFAVVEAFSSVFWFPMRAANLGIIAILGEMRMNRRLVFSVSGFGIFLVCASAAWAADQPTVANIYDRQLTIVEHDVVGLAEAMPADKYGFAPTQGEFKGVRTFAEQVKHLASVVYLSSAAVLGQKPPVDTGGEAGPASVKTKEQIVAYLKGAFAYGHKAMNSLTEKNQLDLVQSPMGESTRAASAGMAAWHSFDHYGQMVVYARMNGIVPPASR
jgi:DinB superfamily